MNWQLIQKVKASSNEADTASLLQTKLICEKIEDEMVSLEEKDLRVIVDRPEKVIRTVESYVLFHVSTQVGIGLVSYQLHEASGQRL